MTSRLLKRHDQHIYKCIYMLYNKCILKLFPGATVLCHTSLRPVHKSTTINSTIRTVGVAILRCCRLLCPLCPLSPREAFNLLSFYRIVIVYRFIVIVIELSIFFDKILSFLYRTILSKVSIRYPTLFS